jgi:hypothetical protein
VMLDPGAPIADLREGGRWGGRARTRVVRCCQSWSGADHPMGPPWSMLGGAAIGGSGVVDLVYPEVTLIGFLANQKCFDSRQRQLRHTGL